MSSNRERTSDEFIEVYYLKGRPDAILSCSKEFSIGEADSLGEIIIERFEYQRIVRYLEEANDVTEESNACSMFMQCNFNGHDTVSKRLCISDFNCTLLDNKQVTVNDSLIYLLRTYSGYYNYVGREDLDFFEEIQMFGSPNNYKDLSKLKKSPRKYFARIIIRPEKYNLEPE